MTVTSSIKRSRLLTKDFWWPILQGAFFSLMIVVIVILLVVPDNQEIDVDEYRWLMEQVDSYPEIKERVYEKLSDADGYISNWELWKLKKEIRKHARDALLEKLRAEPQP